MKGDEVLKHIGSCIKNSIRETDIPYRYGGDEFYIIFIDCNIGDAESICEKIINKFSDKYPEYSLSFGISTTGPDQYVDEGNLIAMADENMYAAKKEAGSYIQL